MSDITLGPIDIAEIPFCFGTICPDSENYEPMTQGLVYRMVVSLAALVFFTTWYSIALSVAAGWNVLWGYWLVVKVYLDIAIEFAALVLG